MSKIEAILVLAQILAKLFGKPVPTRKEISDAVDNMDTSALDALFGELPKHEPGPTGED